MLPVPHAREHRSQRDDINGSKATIEWLSERKMKELRTGLRSWIELFLTRWHPVWQHGIINFDLSSMNEWIKRAQSCFILDLGYKIKCINLGLSWKTQK